MQVFSLKVACNFLMQLNIISFLSANLNIQKEKKILSLIFMADMVQLI